MDNRQLISLRTLIVSLGVTAATSLVGVYGVLLGASASEMGWLQSSSNSLSNAGQLLWGRISDRIGRRMPFLAAASAMLCLLWIMMALIRTPVELILTYALISLIGAMITVNWFSLIADVVESRRRGSFLAAVNNIGSAATLVSVFAMIFVLHGSSPSELRIPFFAAALSYAVTTLLVIRLRERRHMARVTGSILRTLRKLRKDGIFHRYFLAMNVQGIFWSMAWPIFPITIILIMHFSLPDVAFLTAINIGGTIAGQFLFGRYVDRINRVPLIFFNRLMLCAIPAFYAFFYTFPQFIFLEVYSGLAGAIQSVVMNSYLMDIVPSEHRAEYISIMNGFNGIVYFAGALTGGYMLQFLLEAYPLKSALVIAYSVVVIGRFGSSFLFLKLKEPDMRGRENFGLYSILLRFKQPGLPSGGNIKPR